MGIIEETRQKIESHKKLLERELDFRRWEKVRPRLIGATILLGLAAIASTIWGVSASYTLSDERKDRTAQTSQMTAEHNEYVEETKDYDAVKKERDFLREANGELHQLRIDHAELTRKCTSLEAILTTSSEKKKRLAELDEFFRKKSSRYISLIEEKFDNLNPAAWDAQAEKLVSLLEDIENSKDKYKGLPIRNLDVLNESILHALDLYDEIEQKIREGAKGSSRISDLEAALKQVRADFSDYELKKEIEIAGLTSERDKYKEQYRVELEKVVDGLEEIKKQKAIISDLETRIRQVTRQKGLVDIKFEKYQKGHKHTNGSWDNMRGELARARQEAREVRSNLTSTESQYEDLLFNATTHVLGAEEGIKYLHFNLYYYPVKGKPVLRAIGGEWDMDLMDRLKFFSGLIGAMASGRKDSIDKVRVEVQNDKGKPAYYLTCLYDNGHKPDRHRLEKKKILEFITYTVKYQ